MNVNNLLIYNISILTTLKPYFPSSKFFMFFFLLFKFIGVILLTNSLEYHHNSSLATFRIFSNFTYYSSLSRKKINIIPYPIICCIIYILLLIPIITFITLNLSSFAFSNNMNKKLAINAKVYFLKNNSEQYKVKLSNKMKIFIIFNTIYFIAIVFFSQYIIEILGFVYCCYIKSDIISEERNNIKNKIYLLVFNSLFIVIINVYTFFFFIVFNNPMLSDKFVFKHNHSNFFLIILNIIFNSQALHYYSFLINNKNDLSEVAMVVTFLCLLFVLLFLYVKSYTNFHFYNILMLSLILFAVYSSILSLIMEVQNEEENLPNSFYILKHILVFILIYVTLYFWRAIQERVMDKMIYENLFLKTKNIESNYIFRLVELINGLSTNLQDLGYLYQLIGKHQEKCNSGDECGIDSLNIKKIYSNLKENQISEKRALDHKNKEKNYFKKFFEIIELCENEISNLITSIYINKKLKSKINIVFLHCNYVFYVTKNLRLSLFLIEEYMCKIKNIPSQYLLYFCDLKKEILSYYKDEMLDKSRKNYQINLKSQQFLDYFNTICEIKKNLLNCCIDYQEIIFLKNNYLELLQNANSNYGLRTTHLEKMFNKSMTIAKSLSKVQKILEEHFDVHPLKNPEVCYLLTNFYIITSQKIPKNLSKYFTYVQDYDSIEKSSTSFLDIKYQHPLMFTVRDNSIVYISQKLSNILKFQQKDLIGKDFHILLPSILMEQHSLLLKKCMFVHKIYNIYQQNIFLIDKEKYYYKAKIMASLLPTFENKLMVISDISLKNKYINSYLFILDIDTRLVAMTSNFPEKYELSYDIINRIGINFCTFFGINYEKVKKSFKDKIKAIEESNLQNINGLFPFEHRSLESTLSLYHNNYDEKKNLTIKTTRSKAMLKPILQRFKKDIQEKELDLIWLQKLNNLEEILSYELSIHPKSSFEITIQMHHIGNCGYYYIKVYDKDEDIYFQGTKKGHISFTVLNPFSKQKTITPTREKQLIEIEKDDSFEKSKRYENTIDSFAGRSSKRFDSVVINSTNRNMISTHASSFYSNANASLNNTKLNLLYSKKTKNKGQDEKYSTKTKTFPPLIEGMDSHQIIKNVIPFYEQMITILVLMFEVCILGILASSFFHKKNIYLVLEDFLDINIILLKLKEYLIETSLIITTGCFIVDGITSSEIDSVDLPISTIKPLIALSSDYYFNEFKSLHTFFSKYTNDELVIDITQTLYRKKNYTRLNNDYSVRTYQSDLNTELYNFHYHSTALNRPSSFKKCKVKDFYLDTKDFSNETSSGEDRIMYYISKNVVSNFMDRINTMNYKANKFLTEDYYRDRGKIILFNICLLVIGIVLCLGFVWLLVIKKNKIKYLLLFFLSKNSKTRIFEEKLDNFQKILVSLDNQICQVYEKSKTVSTSKKGISFLSKLTKKENINEKFNFGREEIKTKKTNKGTKSSLKQTKLCNFDSPIKGKETDESGKSYFTINFSVFSLSSIRNAFILVILFLLIHIGLLLLNIFIDEELFYDIFMSKRLSYYYLDRTPTYNEILLYHRISILYNDPFFLETQFEDYPKYLVNFDLHSTQLGTENDKSFQILDTSKMGFLYYRLNLESRQIKQFEMEQKKIILKQRYEYSQQLKVKSGSCKKISNGFVEKNLSQFEGFNETYLEYACLKLSGGVHDSGSSNPLTSFFTYLMDEYLDFMGQNEEGDVNIMGFLQSHLYLSILYAMTFSYNISWKITSGLIKEDIRHLFKNIHNVELCFQIIELVITLLYSVFFLIYILVFLHKKIINFAKVVRRLNFVIL